MEKLLKGKLPQQFQPIFKSQRTLPQEKVPVPFREKYILKGYRLVNESWTYYFISLFNWHNETLNVWTHLVAFVYIILHTLSLSEKYDFINTSDGATMLGYAIGALAVTSLSTIAHLFHARSLEYHYMFFMLDYMGVSMYSLGCGILTLYRFCPPDAYQVIGPYYLPVHLLLCFNNFFSISTAKLYYTGATRKLLTVTACIASTTSLLVPIFISYYKCYSEPECLMSSLNHRALMYFFLFLSTCAYLAHQPEMTKPGTFDIIGHSHQWFHIFIFCTILAQFNAMEHEMSLYGSVITEVKFSYVISLYVIITALNVITLICCIPSLKKKTLEIIQSEQIKRR